MIIHQSRDFMSLLLSLEGSIVPIILPKVLMGVVFGLAASVLVFYGYPLPYDFTSFTVFGVALSLFLGFRNNACYDRSGGCALMMTALRLMAVTLTHLL
jgi:putative membrane protein